MSKSKFVLGILSVLFFFGCYYDNEEELYGGTPCNVVSVSFSKDIMPLIQTECAISGCHVQGGAGNGVFENYQNIKSKVDNGSLNNRVLVQRDMPPSSPLSNCQIEFIEEWIKQGAPNN
ncbi:MAG: hypothetical protein CMC96_05790 [Flavobacteriales bacterium]|nr:hypothetical protein [Flavobacteriales bacterium]|tara:strand:+ start:10122 stop:10478 length:357 start_codon:yes stop_codon:yes gene_type:complete